MQTHYDQSHRSQFLAELQGRADKAQQAGVSKIASEGEPLAVWKAENGMYVQHMPDDEQGILRISVGGGDHLPVTLNYCTIRGKVGECIKLLGMAIEALRQCPE